MRVCRFCLPIAAALMLAITLVACGDGAAPDDGAGDNVVEVVGTAGLAFEPAMLNAQAGEVTVALTAEEAVNHDFVIEDLDDLLVVEAGAGETETGTVELEPGVYTFYCSVPGHRPAGMEGMLTVE